MKIRKILVVIILLIAIFFNIETVNATYEEHTITKLATSDSGVLDQTITDGDSFIEKADSNVKVITPDDAKSVTDTIYGVLMLFGMATAVIVGLIIGMKYMMSTVDEKAAAKKQLVVYFIGCVVVLGSITIWRAVVGLLNSAL